jgi:hypothetical protein
MTLLVHFSNLIMPGLGPGIIPSECEEDARIKCGHDEQLELTVRALPSLHRKYSPGSRLR